MPRSLRLAVATACVLACLGAVSAAAWIADASGGGRGTRWLATALRVDEGAVRRAASPLYLAAIAVVPIVLRRDARKATIAFQLALLATITLGVMALGLAGGGEQALRLDAGRAGMLLAVGLFGLLAWSLSRPSARAWLESGRAER
jgi:hypothetical protein